MKRSITSLIGFGIGATDGKIGKVKAFYFDEATWTIRYLIVETGSWLCSRNVLISPVSLLTPDWENAFFYANLSMEQIKNSPDIDTEKPISRKQELTLYAHYFWGSHSGNNMNTGIMPAPVSMYDLILGEEINTDNITEQENANMRSTEEVIGYDIHALDGKIGTITDFLMEDSSWEIEFMIIEAGSWFHEKKALISPKWIKEINGATYEVRITGSLEQIKNSPEYDIHNPLTENDVTSHYNYYHAMISPSI